MLTSRNATGGVVLAEDAARDERHWCPECDASVILKRGAIVVPHFAHEAYSGCPYAVGESARHLEMKLQIGRRFNTLPLFPSVQYEVRFGAARRADVVLTDHKVVVECQASAISIDEIRARTWDYNDEGYGVLWVFDEERLPDQTDWRGRPIPVRVPAEIRYIHGAAYGHLYLLTAEGTLMACHLERCAARVTEYGTYVPKTLRWVTFHAAGAIPLPCAGSCDDLGLVKLSEGIWWKLGRGR